MWDIRNICQGISGRVENVDEDTDALFVHFQTLGEGLPGQVVLLSVGKLIVLPVHELFHDLVEVLQRLIEVLQLYLSADQVDDLADLDDGLLRQFLHEQFGHELDLLPLVSALPDEDIVELDVGGEGEVSVVHEGLDQHPHQLHVALPHDVLEEFVVLEVVDKSDLFLKRVVEDAESWLHVLFKQLELLLQVGHARLLLSYVGHLHSLLPLDLHLQVLPKILELLVYVQDLHHPLYLLIMPLLAHLALLTDLVVWLELIIRISPLQRRYPLFLGEGDRGRYRRFIWSDFKYCIDSFLKHHLSNSILLILVYIVFR